MQRIPPYIYTRRDKVNTYLSISLLTDGKVLELLDIHPDLDRARQFLEQLLGEEAEEKQLWYYLEDFLAR